MTALAGWILLWLRAWSGVAVGACPAAPADLSRTIDHALQSWVSVQADAFLEDAAALRADVGCLSAPLLPEDAARLHLVLGLQAWRTRDEPRVIAALRGVRAASPAFVLSEEVAPLGGTLRDLYAKAERLGPGAEVQVWLLEVNVDGVVRAGVVPSERAALVFWWDGGGVGHARYLEGGESVEALMDALPPPLPALSAVPVPLATHARTSRWLAGAAAVGVAAGAGSLTAAAALKGSFESAREAQDDASGQAFYTSNRVTGVTGYTLVAASGGLLLTAAIVGRW